MKETSYSQCGSLFNYSTGVGRGGRPPTQKGGQHPISPPPTFHGSPLSALPSVYQFISCRTLGSTALALVGHFRVLENETFSTPCEGETPPTPSPTRSLRSLVCVAPPLLNLFLRLCCSIHCINLNTRCTGHNTKY